MSSQQEDRTNPARDAERRAAEPEAAAGGAHAPGIDAGDERSAPKLSFKEHVRWLWRYWQPHRPILVFLAFFTLVSATVTVAYPRVLGIVIDRFTESVGTDGAGAKIMEVMLILGAIMIARFIASLYPPTRALMNARLERDIREDVFNRLMGKDYRFNNAFRTGDVVTRLTDDIAEFPKIAWFGCSGVFRAIESSAKLIFCLIVMAHLSGKLTLLAVTPMPIMMWIFYALRHRLRYYMETSQKYVSKTNNLLEAVFSGIRIVKAFRAEDGQRKRLADIMKERVAVLLGLMKLEVLIHAMDTFASRLGQMVVISYGGYLVIQGELSIGTLVAFYIYLDMLAWPMMDVPFLFMTGQQAFVSLDRVEEIRSFPVTETRAVGAPLEEMRELAFERVSFSYNGRKSVNQLSFATPAGAKVALVGPVASGKSTVLKLIAGILNPQEGRILVNGRPLTECDWDSYRRLIGYVPQEAVLFSKSIEENVLFGRPAPAETYAAAGAATSRADAREAKLPVEARRANLPIEARQANLPEDPEARAQAEEAWARQCLSVAQMDPDLEALADGIDTSVGQKGGLVSGGQKQRIAIARALAGRPQMLLLDDCTAALDAQNEDRFWAQLEEEFSGRTCFIVSHRLATIRRADTILVLEDGALVGAGTHEDLVLGCETYREFLQTERAKAQLGVTPGSS
jgi:ATP-binding cassette subfamily B protein